MSGSATTYLETTQKAVGRCLVQRRGEEVMTAIGSKAPQRLESQTDMPASQGTDAVAFVDRWPVHLCNPAHAISEIISRARSALGFTVFTLNLDHLVKLREEQAFRRAYAGASLVTADGAPIAALASMQGMKVERTTGSDIVVPLAKAACDAAVPVFLFGSSPDVLERAARRLKRATNGRLKIVGQLAPAYGFDPCGEAADAAIDEIQASGAKLCFVALGAPKQEVFAHHAVQRGAKLGFICIGAGLDFLAGHQKRAPKILQRSGLEWVWRLMHEPRRMAVRYMKCAIVLADIVIGNGVRRLGRQQIRFDIPTSFRKRQALAYSTSSEKFRNL